MENYIQNIELINTYLNKMLSEKESKDFEDRLRTETNLKDLYEEHIIFLEGLKRQQLKVEIIKAKQFYIRNKWFLYMGFTTVVLIFTVLGLIYIKKNSSNTIKTNELPIEIQKPKIVLDSVMSEVFLEEETVVKDTLKREAIVDEIKSKREMVKVETPKKSSQMFVLNSQKDTTIVCNEGTTLTFKANSFIDSKGSIINGHVDFIVTEYYKISDILLANLSTQSDGKQLETAGMLFIEAKKGDLDLKLRENSDVEISFPTVNKKEGMQIFSGEWKNGIINWNLEREQEPIIDVEEENVDVPFAVVEEVPIYPGCENLDKQSIKNCTSKAIREFIQSNFNIEIPATIGLTGKQRINTLFKINQDGDVVSIRSRANHPLLEEEANRVIALLPKMIPGKQRGKTVSVPYSLPIVFQVEGDSTKTLISGRNALLLREAIVTLDSIAVKNLEDIIVSKDRVRLNEAIVKSYILRTSKLGWINCDRFINRSGQRLKYKLKIKNRNGGAKVSMVFKSLNSILPSRNINGSFDFGSVLKDEDIILVAIKKDKGKLYLDIIDAKTETNPDIEFNFKEVTIQEMKNELKKLNKI